MLQVSRARAAVDSMFLMEDKLKSGKEPVHTYKNAKIKLMSSKIVNNIFFSD